MSQSAAPRGRPRLQAPPGAVDTHMHIYLPQRFPYQPGPAHKPPEANVAMYTAMLARIGVERAVIVQPAAYGTDNRCTVAAVAELGPRARGVATVAADVGEAELQRLSEAGIRGARFFMLPGGILRWEELEAIAARVTPFGWHLHVQFDGREFPQRLALLKRLPGQIVVAHTGKFLEPVPPTHPAFRALLELLETGRCWVKLSAPYETSRSGPPLYDDVAALARALVRAAPERMLWASNWPHPSEPGDAKPDEAMLLDTLLDWAPDDATRERILRDNPVQLYGFDA
jgi:D-galactarolactone isomerase